MSIDFFPHKAMVLAAGLGKRMRPLTEHMPKPLVPVNGIPLIDRVLDWLMDAGVNEAVVNSHYKAEMLEAHLEGRRHPAIRISREELLLETGGGIKRALPLLGAAPFFSVNSDTLCINGPVPALKRLALAWNEETMDALLLLHPTSQAIGYEGRGDFFLTDDGVLRRPDAASAASSQVPFVFTGVQLLHPRLFAGAPDGPFSMNVLYNRGIKDDGSLHRVAAVIHDGHWLHVGDPKGLQQATSWLQKHGR